MKVSVSWLKELVAVNLTVEEIAHKLTMAGLEVEEQTPIAAMFNNIVVAEVKTVVPHPNADKLRVTEVDAGTGELLQIVCGAPNVEVGMRVPCAKVGAILPDFEIRQAKLRGVESNGMLCSARELGLSDDHAGLLPLPADAPIGEDIRKYLDLDDTILTLKITPNRGDCLSMFGVARDLAAITGAVLRLPQSKAVATTGTDQRGVKISAPEACGHYLGRVITNINARARTPEWLKRRLERGGFRSISPLVDITNFLTLERGRPMHAFDNDKLDGGIDVRFPKKGEAMNLLNAQHAILQPDMLLIADSHGPVAIGGVMGGLESSVTDATTNIFFEAAYFNPDTIQGKTRTLAINSDAAFRFERGVDPASAKDGIERATELTIAICGTSQTSIGPIIEAIGVRPVRPPVYVRPARLVSLIGMSIDHAEMLDIFARLNCEVSETGEGDALKITPPSYRFDLNIEEDFAEEIARIKGYENVPAAPPRASVPIKAIPAGYRSPMRLRHILADLGYQEVINYSFVPESWETELVGNESPVRLSNPIASQMNVMRTSLLGGLISSLQYNLNRGESRIKMFEIGRCFTGSKADLSDQPERVAGLAYGPRHAEQWGEDKADGMDFYTVKGDVEAFLAGFPIRFETTLHDALHPGRAAAVFVNSAKIGWIGELHPRWQQQYGFGTAPVAFELDVSAITNLPEIRYRTISKMQAVRRDVALLVDDTVTLQAITDVTKSLKLVNLVDFRLFDLYRGRNLEAGKKSLAFRILMQDTERTLTDVECDETVAAFVKVMSQKFGATLRK